METLRQYWEEPFRVDFRARIVKIAEIGLGETRGRVGLVLDRTLFHPEGGGQPSDQGCVSLLSEEARLAFGRSDLTITDVVEDGAEIVHLVDGPMSAGSFPGGLPAAPIDGWEVRGKIDWDLRFDLMQQHTGQHILSRAFEELLDAKTVGFHLGKDYVSIDLDIQALSVADKDRVEDRANEVVFGGALVTAKEYAKSELPKEIRTRLHIDSDRVRVVTVGDFDACACAGTHVACSGQVGLIKVNQVDRAHGGVRVVFRCGKRALFDYREKETLLSSAASFLSAAPAAVPAAVDSALQRLRQTEKDLEAACQTILEFQVEKRARAAQESGEPVVVEVFESLSPDRLKLAARKLSESTGKLTVCFSKEPRFSAIVMSPAGAADARVVASRIALRWGGRGGGTPGLAQLGSKEPLSARDSDVVAGIKAACMEVVAGAQ